MKKYILLLLLVVAGHSYSQSVNDYKAVVVPVKFDFLKNDNQYRLNTLSKFNLKKAGFEAFYTNEQIPAQFSKRCDLLYFNVENEKGFLITKLFITLKDCEGKIVFQSVTGKSKEKEYEAAYVACLNEAFESVNALNYSYNGSVKAEILDKPQEQGVVVEVKPIQNNKMEEVELTANKANLLYAQPIENGYQLVDASPKVVMKVIRTSSPSTYIAIKGEVQGVLVSKNGTWYFEYYKNQELISEKIEVKF